MSPVNSSRQAIQRIRYWEPPLPVTAVFLVFVVARYMQWGARKDILSTIRIEFLLGLTLTISCAFLLSSSPIQWNRVPAVKKVITGISLLFVAMIVQIPFAADGPLAQQIFVDRVIKFAMLTFFMVVLIRSPKVLRWFMVAFLFGCFYVTQESTRGAISGSLVWQNQGIMRLHGAVPIYRHPNSLAGLAIGVLPFIVYLFPVIRRWTLKLALLPLLLTSMVCLLFSGSRTGYLAFIVFGLFWLLRSRHKWKALLLVVGLCVIAYPLIPGQYRERFMSIGGQEAEGNSREKRVEIITDAMTILVENPIGVGVASFPAVRGERFGRNQDTHNLYLEVATNLGVQGLLIFFYLLISLFWLFRDTQLLLSRSEHQLRGLVHQKKVARQKAAEILSDLSYIRAVTSASEGFLVIRLALGLFGMDLYEVYWWFIAGLGIAGFMLARTLALVVESMNRRHEIQR
jgi:O-antigen ligase